MARTRPSKPCACGCHRKATSGHKLAYYCRTTNSLRKEIGQLKSDLTFAQELAAAVDPVSQEIGEYSPSDGAEAEDLRREIEALEFEHTEDADAVQAVLDKVAARDSMRWLVSQDSEEVDQMRNRIAELEADLSAAEADSEGWSARLAAAESARDSATATVRQLTERVGALEIDLDATQKSLSTSRGVARGQEAQLKRAREQNTSLIVQRDVAERERNDWRRAHDAIDKLHTAALSERDKHCTRAQAMHRRAQRAEGLVARVHSMSNYPKATPRATARDLIDEMESFWDAEVESSAVLSSEKAEWKALAKKNTEDLSAALEDAAAALGKASKDIAWLEKVVIGIGIAAAIGGAISGMAIASVLGAFFAII